MGLNAVDKILIFLLLFSIQATNLKLADVQIFEILVVVSLPYMLLRCRGFFPREMIRLCLPMILFFFYAAFYCYFTQTFFSPGDYSPLKKPLLLSLVRIAQFSLIFFSLCYLWVTLQERNEALWAIRAYIRITVILALMTIAAFAFARLTGNIHILVYDTAPSDAGEALAYGKLRARGLFVEGGPYGLSLIPGLGLLYLLKSKGYRIGWVSPVILFSAILLSQSKAAILCLALLILLQAMSTLSLKNAAILLFSLAAIPAIILATDPSILTGYMDYFNIVVNLATNALQADPNDSSMAFGRIAGFLIGPRMFLANFFLGVGLGNYSLVRNNPAYLGPLPAVHGWDLPGLGIFTVLIEGGLVGFLMLLGSYFFFYRDIRRKWGKFRGRILFVIPLAVQVFGVQFYFAYHWVFLCLLSLFLLQAGDTTPKTPARAVPAPRNIPVT